MKKSKKSAKRYTLALAAAFTAGLSPFLFNLVVDPYDMNGIVDLDLKKFKVSEQAHYPLWKMIHYPADGAEVVILGDSRARALREKIWISLGEDAFNFAYGGATIQEIYDTFLHVKTSPKLKTLIVSLPLRSFDLKHRGGLNRVPEAIRMAENPIQYYKSWFVSRIGWRNLDHRYPDFTETVTALVPGTISGAKAANIESPEKAQLSTLLGKDVCNGCRLPLLNQSVPHLTTAKAINLGLGRGYGNWARLWVQASIDRDLPKKFERQVRKNGANDWGKFKFSEKLWGHIEEIAQWSKANDVKLAFVIPPTIVEMQHRMNGFGYADLNHRFRLRLAELAPVFDFDFDSPFTRDLGRFTDAYHFKSKSAHAMVGEIVQVMSDHKKVRARGKKRRKHIICPVRAEDIAHSSTDGIVTVAEGKSCRIWRWNNG